MGDFSDYTFGKKKNGVSFNLDTFKGGIKIDKLSDEKIKLFSGVINENNDGVIDNEEIDKFINKIKLFAKNNNLSMKEAARLISDYKLENITQQDLFNFLEFLSQESKNIKESSVLTDDQSHKTILITYQDGTNETIYPDKSSQINTTGDNGEEIVRNYNADRTLNREVITYADKSVKTTNFKNNLPEFSTFEKDGTITEINYDETGNPEQKAIKSALKTEVFQIENNKELLVSLTENVKGVEQVTNFEYNDDGQLVYKETRLNPEETTGEQYTYQDGRLTQRTMHHQRKNDYFTKENTITLNYGENGKYTSGHYMNHSQYNYPIKGDYSSEFEIRFDENGNFYGYAPNGLTLNELFKTLGIEKGTPLYDKFIEVNKDGIKSYNGGRVKTFDVGGVIKFPEEFIPKVEDLARYINCSPQDEKESYKIQLYDKLDSSGYQTTSITLEKDSSWWEIAKQNLIDMGNKNPSKLEITNNTNLLIVLNDAAWNMNEVVKKGTPITVRSNGGGLKQEFVVDNYRPENLRKMYPSDKYKITRKNVAPETDEYMGAVRPVYSYTVTDKATGKTKLAVTPEFGDYYGYTAENFNVKEYDNTGRVIRTLTLPADISEYSEIVEVRGGKTRVYNWKGVLKTESYKDRNGNNIEITIRNSSEKELWAEDSKGQFLYSIEYKNGKPTKRIDNKGVHYFNKNGDYIYTIKHKNGVSTVNSPIADNLIKFLETNDSKQFIANLNMIDFEHAPFIFAAYKKATEGGDLISDIKSSDLDDKTKQYAAAHLNEFIKQYTTTNFTNKQSSVQNSNYRGANFTVSLNGTEINIKNSAGETSSIDLADLLENTTEYERAALGKTISELPGEVLWDLSKECSKMKVNDNPYSRKNSDVRIGGYYSLLHDDITIIDAGLYNFPNILSKDMKKSFDATSLREIVIHELGHAIDYNGYLNNSPSSENSFKDTFEQELKGYLAAGKVQYKSEPDFTKIVDIDQGIIDYNTCYATLNQKEMFAECYTLLMNGDCQSKDHIEKYFPKTLQAAKALLQEIRNKNDFERHNPIHM